MGKAVGQKSDNTFRFQTFSERLSNVNIDVIHQIRHHDDAPEEKGTYFGEALDKHSELNLTDHFTAFRREISEQVQTFEQLVHHETQIVAALRKHLVIPGSMAIPDLLDLVVQLARDLQMDFYRHFRDFFDILIKLLKVHIQNVEVLESTFTCLSYIFKFLWRYLVKDIEHVYGYFSALLSGQYKEYIRNFAAESFAFLMRKVKNHSGLFDFLLASLMEQPDKCAGVGRLLFEMMKGVKGQFHSCMPKVFPLLLEKLGPRDKETVDMLPWQQVEDVMATTLMSIAQHATKETIQEVWTMLSTSLSECHERWMTSKGKRSKLQQMPMTIERLIRLMTMLAEYKNGLMVTHPDKIGKLLIVLLKGPCLPDTTGQELLKFTSTILVTSHTKMEVQTTSKIIPAVFKTSYPASFLYNFTTSLFNLPLFEKDVLPALLPYCQTHVAMGTELHDLTLLLVTQLVLCKCPPVVDGSQLESTNTYMLDFGPSQQRRTFPLFVVGILDSYVSEENLDPAKLWSALVCLPHIRPLGDSAGVIETIAKLIFRALEYVKGHGELKEETLFVVNQAVSTLIMMLQNQQVFDKLPIQSVMQCLRQHSGSVHVLRMVDIYLSHAVAENVQDFLTADLFKEIYPVLQGNLSSPHAMVRLLTLRILSSFDLPVPSLDADTLNVFRICLCVETTAATVHDYRDKLRHLQKLEHNHIQNSIPMASLQQVPLRYLLGCLFINFNLLWKPIRELIASHALKMDREAFWEVYGNHLEKAAEGAEEMLLKLHNGSASDADDDAAKDIPRLFGQSLRGQGIEGDKADYTNFRLQLWTAMSDFPEQCQPKSRLFAPLLFRFLKNEYYITDLSLAPTQNLLKQSRGSKLQAVIGTSEDSAEYSSQDSSPMKRVQKDTDDEQLPKRVKTRGQAQAGVDDVGEADDLTKNVRNSGSRIRTRSQSTMDESEHEDDNHVWPELTQSRLRTRSQCSLDESIDDEKSSVGSDAGNRKTKIQGNKGADLVKENRKRVRTRRDSSEEEKEDTRQKRIRTRGIGSREKTQQFERSEEMEDNKADIGDTCANTDTGNSGEKQKGGTRKDRKGVRKENKGYSAKKRLSAIGEIENENGSDVRKGVKENGKGGTDESKDGGFEKTRKAATSALIVHLNVFAKLKDPKSLYMEPKLRELYFDLLIHKNVGVQKVAFQCIMTYKLKYLTPYRENFERLLDDASFKNEIVLFSIDHENTIINAEHRAELLPVLMRILYGKMFVKTGKGTAGKQYSGIRQSIVFRFLTGCQPDELKAFIDLVFAPFKQFITDDPYKMVKEMRDSLDMSKVLPLSRISGALNSYNLIFKKLGHLLDQYLPYLIQMIVGMATLSHICLDNRNRLAPFVVHQLKGIRQETVYRIIQRIFKEFSDLDLHCLQNIRAVDKVFTDYDMYDWKTEETDAIFEAIVWPQLKKLSYEGRYSPTPLLRFLDCLTKSPRYISMLAKHHPDSTEFSPLPNVMKLLTNKGVSAGVGAFIMNMVNNLLEQKEDDEMEGEDKVKVIEVSDMIQLASDENVKETDIGTRLLLPHIKAILVHIKRAVTKLQTKTIRKPDKELNILSKISLFVKDEETCKTLAHLLLPFLGRKISISQQTEEDILTSVHNLLKLVPICDPFYMPVCQLFSSIYHRNSRDILCDLYWVVCKKSEELRNLAMIVRKLNSWDKKRMEEPDYMLRLEGFRQANSLVKDMVAIDTDICMALIYNSCYFITNISDMSLRDSSTHCLVTIVKQLREVQCDENVYAKLIRNGLLVEVRVGLRSKTEPIRHEFITILTAIVDTYGDQSAFSTMKLLRDSDPEADFYENIRHIQMHRRTRALRRLIKFLLSNRLSVNAILSYFLPMVSAIIGDETYKKHSGLVDAAVDAIGIMCRQLSWKHYLHALKHYLQQMSKKLQNQKQLVKVIVAVLDAFHFDLSNSTFSMKLNPRVAMETVKQEEADDKKQLEEEEIALFEDEEDKPVPEINEAAEEDETDTVNMKEKQLCSEALATKIHETIVKNVIGHLNKVLTQKIRSEQEHKLVRKNYAEDDEILRVPIALAMVKLLHNLPQGALERYLPGILLKVCNFLKSRSNDIRNTSRDTLIRIQMALGPRFFPFILSELKAILKRGYQRHVLCYTVHSLLTNMADTVRPGDIDVCLGSLQEVFNEEIFGEVSEEKEVEGIVAKVFEARSSKSYDSYLLMAKYIGGHSLLNFMKPLKRILETTHSHKSAKKVQEVLKQVIVGLMDNKDLTIETLLVFAHGLVSDTLPLITEKKRTGVVVKPVDQPGKKPESCLILPREAPRGGLKPKTSKKTNQHVLVEFGLQLLNTCLKKGKIVSSDTAHLQMLDPLVPHLAECLFSKYIKVNADCLRVLCWILRFDLPAIETNATKIANGMFILLRNYASAGAAKGDNKELVSMAFKAVTVLVRDVKQHKLETDQLHVLLTFCEEDLHDYTRQSTAFSLLKAILSRKLNIPELHELMKKVEEMSITAEAPHVQRQCRQVMLQYLMDYPLGNKVKKHLEFYVSQLSYEQENGRESALEMMAAFFTTFPQNLLFEYSGLFFIPMAANLVNDDSAKCRKVTALAIKSLLEKIDHNNRTNLFKIAMKWFMDEKLRHRVLAAQLCGLFVDVESAKFEHRLEEVLPLIEQQMEPGKYEQMRKKQSMEHDEDHMIYNTLNTLLKILRECPFVLTDSKWNSTMSVIWEYVQNYLTYPHVWVQLISSQLFGLLFATWEPDQLITLETETRQHYLTRDTNKKLRQLTFDLMTQFQSEYLNEDIASQIIKNMVFIAKCARLMDERPDFGPPPAPAEAGEEVERRLSLQWLVRKMVREAHHEAIHQTKSSIKRKNVFKWIASVCLDLGELIPHELLRTILPPLQREISDQLINQDPDLKTLSQEVVELVKKTVGLERFTEIYASSQRARVAKKEERKTNKAFQAVANPEVAAKRKIKKNLAKKESKKRKIEERRPSKKVLKKKHKDFTMKD